VYDEDLTNLEDGLRRLKVEYDIFFNGHRKRPPDDLRLRVEKIVKRLSEVSNMSLAERFRYNTLVTRFYVMRDLWRRTVQQRELGAQRDAAMPPAPRPQAPPTPPGEPPRMQLRVSISDPSVEEDKIRRMYDAMVELRGQRGDQTSAVPYQQFARYVAAQTANIQGKFGCRSVQFAISMDQDAIRFTARAEAPPPRETRE
jgi:hypothetical protein